MLRRLVTSKKPLVIVPVVLALVLAGLFLPVMKVSIEPYGRLSLESKITLSVGTEVAYASPGWVSPTGFVDGGGVWTDEPKAYDEDTLTFASVSCPAGWCDYLELTIAEITCDKVRLWMGRVNTQVQQVAVDVYYNSAWDPIYSGAFVIGSFQEFAIGSEQLVTAMRIRFFSSKANRQAEIYEAEFNEVVPLPDISVSPADYNFGTVEESSEPYTTTTYFAIDNNSTMQTDQTISVTTNTWSGGDGWTHSDTATPGANTAGLLANRGGTWGTGDIIVKNISPNYIYENCPATTDYSFGLQLLAPTSFSDGVEKQIIVMITAVAG